MAVRRRKGSPHWHYDFTVNGHRFRGSCQTDDKPTAQAVEAALRRDILLGTLTNKKPRITLDEACGRYWIEHAHDKSNAATVKIQIKRLLERLGKGTHLDDLSNAAVADYVARRRGDRDPRHKKKVRLISPATVNRELTLLRSILIMARDKWDHEVASINWKAHWMLEPEPRERTLRVDELERLLQECAGHLRPAVEFSLLTGVRLSNCISLDWSQVDLQAREIHFRIKSRRPGRKPHIVPISEPCLLLLARLEPQGRGPVFTRERRGRRVPIKTWRTAWAGALRRAGIEDFRWHDLRHTAATWMIRSGVPLDVVQQILGHQSIQTTMRYAHRDTAERQQAVEALGHAFGTRDFVDARKAKSGKAL